LAAVADGCTHRYGTVEGHDVKKEYAFEVGYISMCHAVNVLCYAYTAVSRKKRDQNVFHNISYNTQVMQTKFGTAHRFPNKFATK